MFTTPSFQKKKSLKIDFNRKFEYLRTCPDENFSFEKFLKIKPIIEKKKRKKQKGEKTERNDFKNKCQTLLSKEK